MVCSSSSKERMSIVLVYASARQAQEFVRFRHYLIEIFMTAQPDERIPANN
jgi:hypothetical protein